MVYVTKHHKLRSFWEGKRCQVGVRSNCC